MSKERMEIADQLKVTIGKIKCLGFLLSQQHFCEVDVNDEDDIEYGLCALFKEIYDKLDSIREQLGTEAK